MYAWVPIMANDRLLPGVRSRPRTGGWGAQSPHIWAGAGAGTRTPEARNTTRAGTEGYPTLAECYKVAALNAANRLAAGSD